MLAVAFQAIPSCFDVQKVGTATKPCDKFYPFVFLWAKVRFEAMFFFDGVVEYELTRLLSGLVPFTFEPFLCSLLDERRVRQRVLGASLAANQCFRIKSVITGSKYNNIMKMA